MRSKYLSLFLKILVWLGIALALGFVALVIVRMVQLKEEERTAAEVERIHSTKLTVDDVMGKNLPPDPGADADKTIAGIDANTNGIRDDVELAIFKAYPDSAKTRAVLLQYALALQMEVTQPIVNEGTVTEVVREQSRAYSCVGEILSREDMNKYIEEGRILRSFVSERQRDTSERKKVRKDFIEKVGAYSESENKVCDIDISALPN
ncbi:MAG: hypothetical protein AAB916_02925 [Patescibacteria group bacterium]